MLAFCWAHLRRGFFDIAKSGSAPTTSEALERIASLDKDRRCIRLAASMTLVTVVPYGDYFAPWTIA